MMSDLNTFQQWAKDRCEPLGIEVKPCGNWVKLCKDGVEVECMSVFGVAAVAGFKLKDRIHA